MNIKRDFTCLRTAPIEIANCHWIIRLHNIYKIEYIRFPSPTRARKRGSAQDATKFNSVELSRFTLAIQPIMYRCHELSLQRIE